MPFRFVPLLLILTGFWACRSAKPAGAFDARNTPAPPDYADLANWAAHPDKTDPADRTPRPLAGGTLRDEQATAAVDVFYLYPTTYTGSRRTDRQWNADTRDAGLNAKTDGSPILYQASIFNGAGRVFAPRYRQAHYHTFFSADKKSAQAALDLAYDDVKSAFRYYLDHWNQGRPFIIAGHSQGGRHGMYLLRDLVEGTPYEKQFVVAYLAGWPVRADFFKNTPPCQTPDQTGCFCSWRTWERRYGLKKLGKNAEEAVCTNPLNWTTTEGERVVKRKNQGAVLRKFSTILPGVADAEVHNGYLLSVKPRFPGSFLLIRKNYHIGDFNLYYLDVRENARLRADSFVRRR